MSFGSKWQQFLYSDFEKTFLPLSRTLKHVCIMKHYLKVILPLAVIAVSFFFLNPVKSSPRVSDLVLQNVEALAGNEVPNMVCVGTGSVDCPINGAKVKRVVESL